MSTGGTMRAAQPRPYGATGLWTRYQLRHQLLESGIDRAPTGQPVAREAQREIGAVDAALVEAHARRAGGARARAAHHEARLYGGVEEQVLALIGRTVAERDHLQPVGPVELRVGEIARIDRLHALGRAERDRGRLDRHEQAVDRRRGFSGSRLHRRVRRLERGARSEE